MLTGELPFPSQFRKQNIPLTPPKQHNSEISDRVNAAIIKGMELEPQNRPQSVQEWLDLLIPQKVALDLGMAKKAETVQLNLLDLVIPKPAAAETTRVISAVGMDYYNLRDLLAAGKWKEADKETARVMLKVGGMERRRMLDVTSIDKFPCEDLRTIEQLWVKYSNGRFGFSVQNRIFQSLGGTREYDNKIWEAFCERVGWRKKNEEEWQNQWLRYKDLTFSEKAPEAHLPVWVLVCGLRYDKDGDPKDNELNTTGGGYYSPAYGGNFSSLASRLVKCNNI
ncbi:MAG: hypothetical protein EAZ45_20455 [Oscillatoriales cyanobacterium]|nr:MAG: hypothetical protein EAZ45_20455 [Oscillatoriales cyanobacterium]